MPSVYLIDDQAELDQFFADLADEFYGTRMRELMESEVAEVEEVERNSFANQTAPNGQAWAPLKPATIKRKGHSRILVETGRLGVSLTQSGHPDAVVEIVDEPGQGGFSRGTAVEYAGYHQKGTKRMPARPPVGVDEEYVDGFAERAADHLVENLKAGA
ncbi:phage virion morphogenesis protein [Botrimarina mediterranea]|uniref:phage virion morphogenesis protein n=1 Tax=Botrimarina mediterranea TaxID=2528022 RepID=UPI00118C83C2|nr:Phage virion morphogenesis family protein [Planctomycetes bacterium K2D]